MEEAGVVVAGGGPAGLLTASLLRGVEAVVFEASRRPGWPPHCTGIVSPATASRLDAWEAVEAHYAGARFLGPSLEEACSLQPRRGLLAVKLNRPRLEELLASRLEARGHRLLTGKRVLAVVEEQRRARVLVEGTGWVKAEAAVVATGGQAWNPGIPKPPGRERCRSIVGLEARVRLARRVDDTVFTTIHGTSLAPGFFAWIAPLQGGREAVVGLAGGPPATLWERLQRLVKLATRLGVEAVETLEARGGRIMLGPPAASPARGRVYWIGDTLCASKPYTGGGLYAVSILAPALAAAVENREAKRLLEEWGRLRRELVAQHLAARIARKTPKLMLRLLAVACRRAEKGRCRIDFDRHTTLLKCLAKP